MIAVIDTSSLLSLVRYYLPFDANNIMYDYIKSKFETGDLVIVDRVYDECRYTAKSVVIKTLEFLSDKRFKKATKLPLDTSSLIAPSPQRFLNMVDNNFVVMSQKNRLSQTEYESQKYEFMKSADVKQILLCLNEQTKSENGDIAIVTEETRDGNDNKLFQKIPMICSQIGIDTMPLPKLLAMYTDISIKIS